MTPTTLLRSAVEAATQATLRTKLYLLAAAAAVIAALGLYTGSLWSGHRINRLETDVENARAAASAASDSAQQLAAEAAEYRQKIAFLQQQIEGLRAEARKQDETLKQIENSTSDARARVARERGTRTSAATVAELCEKLARLGHGCGDGK